MKVLVGMVAIVVFSFVSMDDSRAALITWTLENVTFDDGGTASGFVTFDPTVPNTPGHTVYLTSFDIKTTAGTVFTAPFEYTSANTDASAPYYVHFFSADEGPTPRHGLPQRYLDLHALHGFPATGGSVGIRGEASGETFVGADLRSLARSISGGSLVGSIGGGSLPGVAVPEPTTLAFVGLGLALWGLSRWRQGWWRLSALW